MKKLLTIMALVGSLTAATAQIGTPFAANMFVSLHGGMDLYHHYHSTSTGPYMGLAVGKWILNPLAFRIGIDLATPPSYRQEAPNTSTFLLASAEWLWDPTATFIRVRNWRVSPYPLLGLGIVRRDSIPMINGGYGVDREVQWMAGLHTAFHFASHWDAFLEYKCIFLPQGFDFSPYNNYKHAVTLGATYRFTELPFFRRTTYESQSTSNDWFLGYGVGLNYSTFDLFQTGLPGGLSMLGVAPEIMAGRNFSNFWTIRFELTGLTAHEVYDTELQQPGDLYTFTMFHADFMANLSHVVRFTRGSKWSIMPYLGAGAVWRYAQVTFDMGADFGLFCRRYLNPAGDLFIDLKYTMVAPRIAGGYTEYQNPFGVGLPSLTVGYIHNFGLSTTRYRQPYDCAD